MKGRTGRTVSRKTLVYVDGPPPLARDPLDKPLRAFREEEKEWSGQGGVCDPLVMFVARGFSGTIGRSLMRGSMAATTTTRAASTTSGRTQGKPPEGFEQVLFIETGVGSDQHGQNATKACVRAARNAIEHNSIPSISRLVPGGYDGMKLFVKIGTPMPDTVDVAEIAKVFPYGELTKVEVVNGGLTWQSGIAIDALDDKNDDAYTAIAAVTVGY